MFRQTAIAASSVIWFVGLAGAPPVHADQLQSVQECTPGKRVVTSDGHNGTVTRIDRAWSYCYVRQDDTGKEVSYLYSLLNSAGDRVAQAGGGAQPAGDNQLAPGVYECFANGHYTFMDMRVTGPGAYEAAGQTGKYHIESSGKIVFETGSLKPYFSKLLSGHRIGLNTNGDSFYATTCELNRSKR